MLYSTMEHYRVIVAWPWFAASISAFEMVLEAWGAPSPETFACFLVFEGPVSRLEKDRDQTGPRLIKTRKFQDRSRPRPQSGLRSIINLRVWDCQGISLWCNPTPSSPYIAPPIYRSHPSSDYPTLSYWPPALPDSPYHLSRPTTC